MPPVQATTTTTTAAAAAGAAGTPVAGVKPKNPKKYKCNYCDRAFSRSEHRSRHERSHTKERPFHCPKCPSTFVRRDLLLRHDRTVHAIRNQANGQRQTQPRKVSAPAVVHGNDNNRSLSALANVASKNSATTDHHNSVVDVDFNAAVLMTELQHSFHKQSAHGGPHPAQGPKIPPSPPQPPHDYLPPLSYATGAAATASGGPPNGQAAHSTMDLGYAKLSPNQTFSQPNPITSPSLQQQQQQQQHQQQQHQSHGYDMGQVMLNPIRQDSNNGNTTNGTNGAMNYSPSIHIPQFDSSFSISSLLKFFNDTDPMKHQGSIGTSQPTRVQLNRYLAAYFTYYHPFLPFLHPQTFDPPTVAPSLLFAVCSIGALLCHENTMASVLHQNAKMLVSSIYEVNKDFPSSSRSAPIWATQSLILTLVYASWSGDPRGLEFISSIRTSLANIASTAVYDVCLANSNRASKSAGEWKTWVHEESVKRTYFAVFVVFGSLSSVFNYPSALANSEIPLKLQLPCSEWLWNASFGSESDWMYYAMRESTLPCFSQTLAALTTGDVQQLNGISPFGLRVLSTALFVEIIQSGRDNSAYREKLLTAARSTWDSIARDTHPGQGQMLTNFALNSTLACVSSPMEEEMNVLFAGASPLMTKVRSSHPLIVGGYIQTLVGQLRLLLDLTSVQDCIRYHVPNDICNASVNALSMLMSTSRLRSSHLTSLVSKAFDLYRIPCLLGIRLMKTLLSVPMFTAAVENVLLGFELTLALVMWCYRVEHDMQTGESLEEDEALLYSVIERTCFDCGLEKLQGQLAPVLALFGADLLESMDSWGLTNVLSLSLRSFAYNLFPRSGSIGSGAQRGQAQGQVQYSRTTTNDVMMPFKATVL